MKQSKNSPLRSNPNRPRATTDEEKLDRVKAAVKRIQAAISTNDPSKLHEEQNRRILRSGRLRLTRTAIWREADIGTKSSVYEIQKIRSYLDELLLPVPQQPGKLTEQLDRTRAQLELERVQAANWTLWFITLLPDDTSLKKARQALRSLTPKDNE